MKKETKKITLKLVLAWIFSVLFIVGGFGSLISSTISGVLIILAGIIILPPFGKFLKKEANIEISGWLKIIIVLVLLALAGSFLKESDDNSNDISLNPQDNLVVNDCNPNWQCSSWSTCSSSGEQTRTCSDSNNCGVLTNKPSESQSCTPLVSKSWHEIKTFSGSSDKTTDTFNIQGDKFKLTYTIDASNDYSIFSFFVYPEGETVMYSESIMSDMGVSGTDSTISYVGKGIYYLKVIAANLDSWEVEIEDYY